MYNYYNIARRVYIIIYKLCFGGNLYLYIYIYIIIYSSFAGVCTYVFVFNSLSLCTLMFLLIAIIFIIA